MLEGSVQSWLVMSARVALALLLLWAASGLLLALLQTHLLYLAARPTLAAVRAEAEPRGLLPWPSADDYRGLVREPAGQARATLVLLHGNAGHAGGRAWFADRFVALGVRVILAEYPGYGPRPGRPGEEALVGDAVATLALARAQNPGPLWLAGESLGAGVAAAAVARAPDAVDALLLITPWDTLANAARHHYFWLPVRTLLRDRYDSVAHLQNWRRPVAVLLAANDRIVPAALGQALYDALPGPKRLWRIPDADHNDWMLAGPASESLWLELLAFMADERPSPTR